MFFLLFGREKKTLWVIFFYCLYTFLNDTLLMSNHLKKMVSIAVTTKTILSFFTIVEFTLFGIFFYRVLEKSLVKKIILIVAPVFLVFDIAYNFSSHLSFDSIPVTIESILVISLCIYYFFEQLNKMQHEFIYSKPEFWAVAGIMLYLAGTFFLFVQAGALSHTTQITFWVINLGCNVLKNIMFAVAFSIKKNNFHTVKNNSAITRTQLN